MCWILSGHLRVQFLVIILMISIQTWQPLHQCNVFFSMTKIKQVHLPDLLLPVTLRLALRQ